MLEIKSDKGKIDIHTDNSSYEDMVVDTALAILGLADHMNDALQKDGQDITIKYSAFMLDIAKVVSVYANMEDKYEGKLS